MQVIRLPMGGRGGPNALRDLGNAAGQVFQSLSIFLSLSLSPLSLFVPGFVFPFSICSGNLASPSSHGGRLTPHPPPLTPTPTTLTQGTGVPKL